MVSNEASAMVSVDRLAHIDSADDQRRVQAELKRIASHLEWEANGRPARI